MPIAKHTGCDSLTKQLLCRLGALLVALLLLAAMGCQETAIRSQSPDETATADEPNVVYIGDMAVPYGLQTVVVESVGLVTNLDGTGCDPEPSGHRAMLLSEMQKRGVKNPNRILADPSTALVIVRAFLRPGIQKGDTFDVEVRIPARDKTTSLRGGYLLRTPLREHAVLGGQMKEGHVLAYAEGPIMVDPGAEEEKDKVLLGRGRILGGGTSVKTRELALVLQPNSQSVRNSAQIGAAVDKRFHTFDHGVKRGVANPKTDELIELKVATRYKDNIPRYLQVIRQIPLRESSRDRSQRLNVLERQLLEPFSAPRAALRLEAIGHEAIEVLKKGMDSDDPEVRFYSAEALAYLDVPAAAAPLAEAARHEPAFRVFALTGLSALNDVSSYEALHELLNAPSAETRYGAFRAMWAMDNRDPFVKGEKLGTFSYHILDCGGPPMVHCTRGFRPEIVLFGPDQQFQLPLLLNAGHNILVQSDENRIVVTKFAPGEPDQQRNVSPRVDEVVRAIVELGGTYPDVVQCLEEADQKKRLEGRFEVDALPQAGREYRRANETAGAKTAPKRRTVTNPLPNLFPERPPAKDKDDQGFVAQPDGPQKKPEKPSWNEKVKRFFHLSSREGG